MPTIQGKARIEDWFTLIATRIARLNPDDTPAGCSVRPRTRAPIRRRGPSSSRRRGAKIMGKATMARSSSLRIRADLRRGVPAAASRERPVDLVHLSHQTMGDAALEREVLGLLARQISPFSGRLDARGRDERRRVAHALKGACLNVGAFRLATGGRSSGERPALVEALGGFETEMTVAGRFRRRSPAPLSHRLADRPGRGPRTHRLTIFRGSFYRTVPDRARRRPTPVR